MLLQATPHPNAFTRNTSPQCFYTQHLTPMLSTQVPKSIPAWKAVFVEPLACSIHAIELGDIQFSDTVVISGCGPLGLGMVTAAKLKNPKLLIALDLFDWKASWTVWEGLRREAKWSIWHGKVQVMEHVH